VSEYIEYLQEVFEPFGPVRARRMFGGYGLYHDGLMFALVVDDVLYLKADHHSRGAFEQAGLPPFEYPRNGQLVKMSYYQAPEELLEDPDQTVVWARRAFEAALRARSGNRPRVQT